MMHSLETRPDSTTGSIDRKRTLNLLWVYPEIALTALTTPSITVGRDQECGVNLASGSVSRAHARIDRTGPIWVLSDTKSKNGTRLNGQPVDRAPLADNDVVRIGDHVAVVFAAEPEAPLQAPLFDEPTPGLMVGPRSLPGWRRLLELAPTQLPVVLEGPTGTGKEVYAKALHALSQRSGELVAINCAAVPEALAESQLFGQTRGAFTGAWQGTRGVVEASHRGTLFLDEIADLPQPLQAKLLRTLEDSQITRLGETTSRQLDLRIVAATQVPLLDLVGEGRFRADLLARLAGGTLRLLPLAQRREEILPLFRRMLEKAGCEANILSVDFVEALCLQDWPLNMRQLAHLAAQVALRGPAQERLRSKDLPTLFARVYGGPSTDSAPTWVATRPSTPDTTRPLSLSSASASASASVSGRRIAWFERHRQQLTALVQELEQNRGNLSRAAKAVGISRQQASRLLATRAKLTGLSPNR